MLRRTQVLSTLCLLLLAPACGEDNHEGDALSEPDAGDGDGDGDGDEDENEDDGDTALSYAKSCLKDASAVLGTRTEVLAFRAGGRAVGFVRHVDPDAPATPGSLQWLPQHFGIFMADDQICVNDAEALGYTNSPNNLADDFTATDPGWNLVFTVEQRQEDHDQPVSFTLEITRDGDPYGEPMPLELESCHELLEDADCKAQYE